MLRRILVGTLLVVVMLALGIGGGAYLWFHQSVNGVRAHSTAVKIAQKELDVLPPGEAATALVIGYDQRAGKEYSSISRSDTVMLVRADPVTKTISLLSFPRDLRVAVYCNHRLLGHRKINEAYADCGPQGTLETVKQLTGLRINYLIRVGFHGFKEIVDQSGGVWMDVDRRYYNKNTGAGYNDYANINLQPGYQLLTGQQALDFARYRHTDSDFVRLARQQAFVRAFKDQVANHFNPLDLPKIVNTITKNVEVGGKFSGGSVIQYGLFAATLPPGHVLQTKLSNVVPGGFGEETASDETIRAAVSEFENPDVGVAKVANASALGTKIKTKTPPAAQTTVLVLNGNGVQGAAANGSYLLGQRGYVMLLPAAGLDPNAPTQNFFHTKLYFDAKSPGAQEAARGLQKLIAPADVLPLPKNPKLRALDPGAMVIVVLGQTFHNQITSAPTANVPVHETAPPVTTEFSESLGLLKPLQHRVSFPLQVPTVIERNSRLDPAPGDKKVRIYRITKDKKAIRLVFRTGGNSYWGIQETDFGDPPALADKSFHHVLKGRVFDLYYSGSHLHMLVLHAHGASYWVVNTLLDDLSNETMIEIAKGLKPLTAVK